MKSRRVFSTRSVSVRSRSTATAPPPGIGAAVTSKVRPGNDGPGPGGKYFSRFTRSPHRSQEIRIANGLDQGRILAGVLRNQFVHGLVGPLHAIIGADGDDGVLHAVEQGLELALAGLQCGKTFFQMAGGFVERGGHLSDFVAGSFLDARGQVSGGDAVGKPHDALQAAGRGLSGDG